MRILLADGGASTRFALCTLLEQNPQWCVVGEISTAAELVERINNNHVDVLLLDWNLPGLNGCETVPAIKQNFPQLGLIILSGRPELKITACTAGADAFVSKTEPPDRLLATISKFSSPGS